MNCCTGTVGVVELVDHLLGVEVRAERVVDGIDGVPDVGLGVLQQVGDLRSDERADGDDEDEEHCGDAEQDERRRRPAPPTPPGEPVHARLDGERQEHRDDEQHEQAVQLAPEVADGEGDEESAPENDDCWDHPRWKASGLDRRRRRIWLRLGLGGSREWLDVAHRLP